MKRWLAVVLLAAGACSKAPSEDQCKQLLEHLIDLEFKKGGATGAGAESMKVDLAKQKAAVMEAKTAEFMVACTEKTHRDRVACALAATDLAGVQKCDEAK
ncbi:MAG TPA: hypothetical protein VNO30_31400 [Kofleriaceae bacterium]|nr:hypothetical protein [Kofleriaceae bacterium]